jgi:hypothetical protein
VIPALSLSRNRASSLFDVVVVGTGSYLANGDSVCCLRPLGGIGSLPDIVHRRSKSSDNPVGDGVGVCDGGFEEVLGSRRLVGCDPSSMLSSRQWVFKFCLFIRS